MNNFTKQELYTLLDSIEHVGEEGMEIECSSCRQNNMINHLQWGSFPCRYCKKQIDNPVKPLATKIVYMIDNYCDDEESECSAATKASLLQKRFKKFL